MCVGGGGMLVTSRPRSKRALVRRLRETRDPSDSCHGTPRSSLALRPVSGDSERRGGTSGAGSAIRESARDTALLLLA